jgi:hypothetical protein
MIAARGGIKNVRPLSLDYAVRRRATVSWHSLIRLLLQGPVLGALVGFFQASATAMVCRLFERPLPYLHDSEFALYLGVVLGGAMVGLPFGMVLYVYERIRDTRVRLQFVIPLLLIIAFAVEVASTMMLLRRRTEYHDWMLLAPKATVVILGLILSIASSRRDRDTPTRPTNVASD